MVPKVFEPLIFDCTWTLVGTCKTRTRFFFFFPVKQYYTFSDYYPKYMCMYSRLSLSRIPRDSLKHSRHPYLEISELQKWGKQEIEQPNLTNEYVIWLLKLETYRKYCGKEEKLLPSFPQYFVTCSWISMLKQGPEFHFEIGGYSR